MNAIGIFLAIILGAWFVISPLIWVYWAFYPEKRPHYRESIEYWIFWGALLGITGLCTAGFEAALFFIPSRLGFYNDNGEFETIRHLISVVLGLCAASFVLYLLHKRESLGRENEALKKELKDRQGD